MKKRAQEQQELEYPEAAPHFWPLCRAIQKNDWKAVENFGSRNPKALTAQVREFSETIFHQIVCFGDEKAIWVLKKLVSKVPSKTLELGDPNKDTALSYATIFGNTKAAEIFASRNKELTSTRNYSGFLPIHLAAWLGYKKTVNYLLSVTEVVRKPYVRDDHLLLLKFLISSNDLFGLCNTFLCINNESTVFSVSFILPPSTCRYSS